MIITLNPFPVFYRWPTNNMTSQDEEADSKKMAVDPKPSIKEVITQFCGYTTAHGLGRLAESQSVFRRVSWSLFCIGALTMFVIQMYNLFLIYLSRPVATVVNVHHESVSMTKLRYAFICKYNKTKVCFVWHKTRANFRWFTYFKLKSST